LALLAQRSFAFRARLGPATPGRVAAPTTTETLNNWGGATPAYGTANLLG